MLIWTNNPIESLALKGYQEARTPIITYFLRPVVDCETHGPRKWAIKIFQSHDPILISEDQQALKDYAQRDFDNRLTSSLEFKSKGSLT